MNIENIYIFSFFFWCYNIVKIKLVKNTLEYSFKTVSELDFFLMSHFTSFFQLEIVNIFKNVASLSFQLHIYPGPFKMSIQEDWAWLTWACLMSLTFWTRYPCVALSSSSFSTTWSSAWATKWRMIGTFYNCVSNFYWHLWYSSYQSSNLFLSCALASKFFVFFVCVFPSKFL